MVDVKATANDAPEPGTSNPATVHIAPGGVGRNIAESVKRLGADVVLASAAGNDPFADYLEEGLEAMGIEAHILRTGATAFDVGWFETSGEMVMGLCDIGGLEQIEAEALLAPVGPLGTYDAAVLEANLPATVLADIAAEMRAASVPYALEPVSIPKAPRLAGALDGAFLVKPNRAEARALSGVETGTTAGARAAAGALRDRGARHVIVSMGADGFYFASDDAGDHLEAAPTEVVDVTGAGDALLAAALVGLIGAVPRAPLERAMQRAAALACSTPGAVARSLSPAIFTDGDEWQRRH